MQNAKGGEQPCSAAQTHISHGETPSAMETELHVGSKHSAGSEHCMGRSYAEPQHSHCIPWPRAAPPCPHGDGFWGSKDNAEHRDSHHTPGMASAASVSRDGKPSWAGRPFSVILLIKKYI